MVQGLYVVVTVSNDREFTLPHFVYNQLNATCHHRMIKKLLNSVVAKYRDLSVSRKSRYFPQPRPINVNCSLVGRVSQCVVLGRHVT